MWESTSTFSSSWHSVDSKEKLRSVQMVLAIIAKADLCVKFSFWKFYKVKLRDQEIPLNKEAIAIKMIIITVVAKGWNVSIMQLRCY